MIKRSSHGRITHPTDDAFAQLRNALGEGVEALRDPRIEERVERYFRHNPTFSRDAVHVAAVACRFRREAGMGCAV